MLAFIKPKIILLDDDQSLLDVIHYYFNEQFKNTVKLTMFSKSCDFLSHLEQHCYLLESPLEIINSFYENEINKEQIIKALKDLSVLSAIIVLDQELRGEVVTGIEISATIREYFPSSYITMLTSNVPNSKAIQLHNDHNIDLFIDKKDTDAIHNLYNYLYKHIETSNSQYTLDPSDVFSQIINLESDQYTTAKHQFLKKINPSCFLTLNGNGDMAIMLDDNCISYWKYNSTKNNFIAHEY